MAKISIKKSFNFNDVSLLLKMNGSNGSTSFIDSSKNNITVTAFGNAQISTAQSKFDGSSAYLDGTGGTYITALNAASFETGDFTVEAWIYPTDNTKGNLLFGMGTSTSGILLSLNYLTVDGISYNWNNNNYIPFNTWSHIALVRNSGIMKIYVNGVEKFSSYLPNQLYTNRILYCGNGYSTIGSAQNAFQGYVDNIRIIQGKARYTSNFTPEQIFQLNIKKIIEGSPVSSISGLSLWLKADAGITMGGGNVNSWADQSPNGNNVIGVPTKKPSYVSNAINGKPALAFNTSRMEGPGIFSGSNPRTMFVVYYTDNANYASNSIVGQSNLNAFTAGTSFILQARNDGLNSNPYLAGLNNDLSGPPYENNVWKIAMADYDGATANLYSNGALVNSGTFSWNTYNTGNCFILGCFYDSNASSYLEYFSGKICEVIVYNKVLTQSEREAVENYLNSKYAIYSSSYVQNGKLRIKTPPPFPTNGLLAFWRLNNPDGLSTISSDFGSYTLNRYGGYTSVPGKINNAFNFSSSSKGMWTNQQIWNLLDNPTSFSVSFWIKMFNNESAYTLMGSAFGSMGFHFDYINDDSYYGGTNYGITMNMSTINGPYSWQRTFAREFASTDTWYHVVGTYNYPSTTMKLYINGDLKDTNTNAIIAPNSQPPWHGFALNGSVYNGGKEYGNNQSFDALGFWNRVLTISEIAQLYNGGDGSEI